MPLDPNYPIAIIKYPDGTEEDLGDRFNSDIHYKALTDDPPEDNKTIAIRLAIKQAKSVGTPKTN